MGVYYCLGYFLVLSKTAWQVLSVPSRIPSPARTACLPVSVTVALPSRRLPPYQHIPGKLCCFPKWSMAQNRLKWAYNSWSPLPLGRASLLLQLHTQIPCRISLQLRILLTLWFYLASSPTFRFFLKASP